MMTPNVNLKFYGDTIEDMEKEVNKMMKPNRDIEMGVIDTSTQRDA